MDNTYQKVSHMIETRGFAVRILSSLGSSGIRSINLKLAIIALCSSIVWSVAFWFGLRSAIPSATSGTTPHSIPTLIVLLLFSVVCSMTIVLFISLTLSRLIKMVATASSQVLKGDLDTRVALNSGDEMEIVARSYNHIVDRLGEMIETVKSLDTHLNVEVSSKQ